MKTNKKEQETVTSTIANLPKELRDRIVNVGTGDFSSGTINHTNLYSTAFLPNSTTAIAKTSEQKKEEKESNIFITINYDASKGSLKSQLKKQGLRFDKKLIKGCEQARIDLLTLIENDILTKKQGFKAFKKLNTIVSYNVIEETFGDVNAELKATFINNKEVK